MLAYKLMLAYPLMIAYHFFITSLQDNHCMQIKRRKGSKRGRNDFGCSLFGLNLNNREGK